MEENSKDYYKFLSFMLLVTLSVPAAAFVLSPNAFTYSIGMLAFLVIASVHEVGHLVPSMVISYQSSSWFLVVAGGTVAEFFVPLLVLIYFFVKRRYALTFVFLVLLGFSLWDIGRYMADANTLSGIGLTTGERMSKHPESHDWHYMFGNLGLLDEATQIGGFFMDAGYILTLMSVLPAIFEVGMLAAGREIDFFAALLLGSVPAALVSLAYLSITRLVISLMILLPTAWYFVRYEYPQIKKTFEDVGLEEERSEGDAKSKKKEV